MSALLFVVPSLLLALWTAAKAENTFRKYRSLGVRGGLTGREAAAAICSAGGVDVEIERASGVLTDHYDPRTRTLRLSPDVHDGRSVSDIAVAAHEAGHALQDVEGRAGPRLRSIVIPAVRFGSFAFVWPLVMWLVTDGAVSRTCLLVGTGLFAATALLQIINLPIEFDASARARDLLTSAGIICNDAENHGVSSVLHAAALTHVTDPLIGLLHPAHRVVALLQRAGTRSSGD